LNEVNRKKGSVGSCVASVRKSSARSLVTSVRYWPSNTVVWPLMLKVDLR